MALLFVSLLHQIYYHEIYVTENIYCSITKGRW